jgi:hypothetical protein
VWEISYRRVLRAGSKHEILRADFKKVRIPHKREWTAPGGFQESKPVPRGATNHRQGTLLLVGGLARGQGALHQDLQRVAMKNYQKSNAINRRPGPTVGGRAQRWVSGAAGKPTSSPNARRNYERYLALAQAEAQSGNTVAAENYYQHAEHYFRSMSSERAK